MAEPPRDGPPSQGEQAARSPAAPAVRVLSSGELLRGGKEVLIEHEGECYRLRLTRNGKLILHK